MDVNLYQYVMNQVLIKKDSLGKDAGITGECSIRIFAGHCYNVQSDFFDDYLNQPNENIITGGGNYLGVISCFSIIEEEKIPDWQKIPTFPITSEFLPYSDDKEADSMDFLKDGYEAAILLKNKLCHLRNNFCDDGTPKSYEKGDENPRCDRITIQIICDKDLKRFLSSIGKKKICNYRRTFKCI